MPDQDHNVHVHRRLLGQSGGNLTANDVMLVAIGKAITTPRLL